ISLSVISSAGDSDSCRTCTNTSYHTRGRYSSYRRITGLISNRLLCIIRIHSRGNLISATYCNSDSCRCCNNTYNSYRITREGRNDVSFISSRLLKVDHIATTSKASYYNFTSVGVWDVNRSGFSSSDNTKTTNGYISDRSQCISVIYFINEDTTT